MFRNYFKISFRNLLKQKNYTIINIAGLSAGIAVCLMIFLIVKFETSYDNFHKKKDRIYRVLTEYHHADAPDVFYGKGVPRGVPAALTASFPQIEKVTPIYTEGDDQILILNDDGKSEKKFKEERGVFFLAPSFFEIFDYGWLSGTPASLKEPNSVVLTKEIAEKYFDDWKNAIGKSIKWNNTYTLKVTGILNTVPRNSDFQIKMVVSYGTGFTADFAKSTEWDGTSISSGCYVLLRKDADVAAINKQLGELSRKMKSPDNHDSQVIQSLSEVHFDTQVGSYSNTTIGRSLIRGLGLIGVFILLIACVNFINLSTAQAVNRSKEVSVRKVLGSDRSQIRTQFLVETFIIVLISVGLSLLISWWALPLIAGILNMPIGFDLAIYPSSYLFLAAIIVVVTILAGFYPSLVLSRFNPVNALKSKAAAVSSKGISLRRALVIFQFVIAQALIIGTLVIVLQMNYFTNRPLGFASDAVINVPFPNDSVSLTKLDYVRNSIAAIKGVKLVSFGTNTPIEDNSDNWNTLRYDHAPKESDFFAITKFCDDRYLSTYQIPLVAGRNLAASDTVREFLVNEKLLTKLNISNPNDVLNKDISIWNDRLKGKVVGVVKDFNNRSFRADLAPLLISTMKRFYSSVGVKVDPKDAMAAVTRMEKIWSDVFPDYVYEYKFMDDKIVSFYEKESKLSYLYKLFAVIAIFLSCLGLYGLASFMAVQKIKEVGIRKVLGASTGRIIYLFSKEFLVLVAIAFAIAAPIAGYFMSQWLEDYVYRINMSWWIFVAGGILSVLIAMATVSFRAIRAAVANPVKSLRTE